MSLYFHINIFIFEYWNPPPRPIKTQWMRKTRELARVFAVFRIQSLWNWFYNFLLNFFSLVFIYRVPLQTIFIILSFLHRFFREFLFSTIFIWSFFRGYSKTIFLFTDFFGFDLRFIFSFAFSFFEHFLSIRIWTVFFVAINWTIVKVGSKNKSVVQCKKKKWKKRRPKCHSWTMRSRILVNSIWQSIEMR